MTKNNVLPEQTSLLDMLPEEERKQFTPEPPKTTKKPEKPVEEKEPDVYEIDRVVFYAGHRLDVPSREMKLEEVRAWLEREHFPELTKERAELVYDKETGHIVPVLKAHKKGQQTITVYTEHPNEILPMYHFLDEDGVIWEVRSTQTGIFKAPKSGKTSVGSFELFVPRIPLSVLDEIVAVFRHDPDIEHLAYIVWDSDYGYSVLWPEQQQTAIAVEGVGFMETETRFVVAHIHSHGRMGAFFSTQDDADEVRSGLYGVIGRCDRDKPEMLFRISSGGNFMFIHAQELFSGDITKVVNVECK